MKISRLLLFIIVFFFTSFFVASVVVAQCANLSKGDANCDRAINLIDFELWRKESIGILNTKSADFNNNGTVTLSDFETWRKTYTGRVNPGVTLTPTRASQATPTIVSSRPPLGVSSGIWISREEIFKLPTK